MKLKNMTRSKSAAINIITGFGGQMFKTLLQFVTRTIFIYTLGKSYLGINGLFTNIISMLSLTELGLDTAINFRLYKPLADKDLDKIRALMNFYKLAYRVTGTVIALLGVCLIPLLPILIKDYSSLQGLGINAVAIFLLYVFNSASTYWFFAYRAAIVKADQKMYLLDIVDYVIAFITNVVQIIVLITTKNFILYTTVLVASCILQNLINSVVSKKHYHEVFIKNDEKLSRTQIRDLFKDCGALFIYKVNGVVLKATDNIVLSVFMGISTVGLFSNYLMFYNTISMILRRLYEASKASMGSLFACDDLDKKHLFFELMNFLTVVLFGTAGVGVVICSDSLINCWIGSDYVIPQPFSLIMGIEILFLGIRINLTQIRNVTGIFRQMWFRPVLSMVINLVASVVLVQYIGIYGVLLGTIISDVVTNFSLDPILIYKYGFDNNKPVSRYYRKQVQYFVVLFFVGLVDYIICSKLIIFEGWLATISKILVCAVSVPLVFFGLYRNSKEGVYLKNIVNNIVKKVKK